jgi:hypothetical protein
MGRTILGLVICAAAGCSPPQVNTTRLDSVDLVAMTDRMTASLVNTPAIAARTADSPRWVITIYRVFNQTSDYLPESERWAFVARLRAQLAEAEALDRRNIDFVMPAAKADAAGAAPARAAPTRVTPTHALTATFHALTVSNRNNRSDTYVCVYQLVDLGNDQLVWADRYEVKYAVERNKFD